MLNKMMHLSRGIPNKAQMYGNFCRDFPNKECIVWDFDGFSDSVSIFWSLGQLREVLVELFSKSPYLEDHPSLSGLYMWGTLQLG